MEPEERRQLFQYTQRGAIGPDKLLQELKSTYPDVFNDIETGNDLIWDLLNKKTEPLKNIEQKAIEYYKAKSRGEGASLSDYFPEDADKISGKPISSEVKNDYSD